MSQGFPPPLPSGNQPPSNQPPNSPPVPVGMQVGRFFRFALPQGWGVQENTNMLCITSPDGNAALMAVGLVGMLQPFTPDQFLMYAMQMSQLGNVRVLGGQPIQPAPGCTSAGAFDVVYGVYGAECQGVIFSHVALGYGQCNASIAMASARAPMWNYFRPWLPQLAQQIGPAGPQTFMAGTVAAQNLQNSIEEGQRYREYLDHSQRLQQQTTNERWASDERNQFHFRETLGGVVTYNHPYESRPVELPQTYSYYWVNRQGRIVGSNDASFDPRTGSTEDWSQMNRHTP